MSHDSVETRSHAEACLVRSVTCWLTDVDTGSRLLSLCSSLLPPRHCPGPSSAIIRAKILLRYDQHLLGHIMAANDSTSCGKIHDGANEKSVDVPLSSQSIFRSQLFSRKKFTHIDTSVDDQPGGTSPTSDPSKQSPIAAVAIDQNTRVEILAFLPNDPGNPYNWPLVKSFRTQDECTSSTHGLTNRLNTGKEILHCDNMYPVNI